MAKAPAGKTVKVAGTSPRAAGRTGYPRAARMVGTTRRGQVVAPSGAPVGVRVDGPKAKRSSAATVKAETAPKAAAKAKSPEAATGKLVQMAKEGTQFSSEGFSLNWPMGGQPEKKAAPEPMPDGLGARLTGGAIMYAK